MLKRFQVVVVAVVAMVALVAGGVVSAVDVISPGSDPNENPDANLEVDSETDPEADPEPGTEEDIVSNIFALNIVEAYPELNLTEADILALRQSGFGWGEISIACGIAVNSGESMDNIIALAGEGTGWGEIAKSLGMEDRAFGQYVRGVIGNGHAYGKDKEKQSELDDAASIDMVLEGYGLSEEDVTELIELGYSAKDVLCAVSLVASTGEASKLELVLRLRTEQQNWSKVAKELGVDDGDMAPGIKARNRTELKNALKQAVKEQVKEHKNKDNKDNKQNNAGNDSNGNKDKDKDKIKPENPGKPAHAGKPGQGAKSSEKDKDKDPSGK